MIVTLHRTPSTEQGTFGILFLNHKPICVTCEDAWRENEQEISCIPSGSYEVVKHNGTKYKDVWRLLNVPDREAILIHNGNTTEDTKGCILVGESFAQFGFLPGINNSRKTLNYLRTILPDSFTLVIT